MTITDEEGVDVVLPLHFSLAPMVWGSRIFGNFCQVQTTNRLPTEYILTSFLFQNPYKQCSVILPCTLRLYFTPLYCPGCVNEGGL